VSPSVLKWSEGLTKRVSIIIRRYTDHMRFAVSFIFFFFYFVSLCIWLYVLYVYIKFCRLCIFIVMFLCGCCYVISVPGILFRCVVLCIDCV